MKIICREDLKGYPHNYESKVAKMLSRLADVLHENVMKVEDVFKGVTIYLGINPTLNKPIDERYKSNLIQKHIYYNEDGTLDIVFPFLANVKQVHPDGEMSSLGHELGHYIQMTYIRDDDPKKTYKWEDWKQSCMPALYKFDFEFSNIANRPQIKTHEDYANSFEKFCFNPRKDERAYRYWVRTLKALKEIHVKEG